MNETTPLSPRESRSGTKKRNLIIFLSLIPIAALFGLLGWGVARSGGNPGGFGVNSKFGEREVEQRFAPEFVEVGLDGDVVSLPGLRGKVVMLDFWSSWCPPCRREAPGIAQVYREYEGMDVEFIGVAIWDDRGDVADYIQEYDLPYPNVLDERGRIAINYGVTGLPEKFFVSAQGRLVRKYVGPIQPDTLRDTLDGLLKPQTTVARGGAGP